MRINTQGSNAQDNQYKDWSITNYAELNLEWLHSLIDYILPLNKKDDDSVLQLSHPKVVLRRESDTGDLCATFYRNPSISIIIKNTLLQSQALNCWNSAHYLVKEHFKTPEPLAYMEEKRFGFTVRSWYVCRFEPGVTAYEYFTQPTAYTAAMANTVTRIVDLFLELKNAQINHGNLSASNILILDNDVSLLDLKTMNYLSNQEKANERWRNDIECFMESWRERYDIHKYFQQAFLKRNIVLS